MPAVPEAATLPDQQQSVGGLPDIHANSPETMFGALGEGLTALGKATGDLSDVYAKHALAVAQLNNKAMSDTAYQGYLDDAGKMEAKFQEDNRSVDPATSTQAYNNYVGSLEQLRQKYRGTLGNMMSQSDFDADSRRMQGYIIMNGSKTIAQGVHTYRETAFNGTQATLAARAAASTDPAEQEDIKQQIANGAYAWGHSEGLPDDAVKADILQRTSAVDVSIIDQRMKTDPEAAMTYYQAHKAEMTPQHQGAIEEQLDGALTLHGAMFAAQAGMAAYSAGQTAPVPGATAGGDHRSLAQIEHDESGGRNIINYKEAAGQKGFTASGYYQITDPTWKEFAPPDVVAKYPRAMDAPKDVQTAVATTMQQKTGNARWAESSHSYMAGTPGANLDILQSHAQGIFAATDQAAEAYAGKWGLDPTMVKYQAEQKVESDMNRQEFQFRQVEDSSRQNLLTALTQPGANGEPPGDLPSLFRQDPNLQSDYNNLTGSDRHMVQGILRGNQNQLTAPRQQEWENVQGMDSATFLKQNPLDPNLDLTNSQRMQMVEQQKTLRNKVQAQQEHDAKLNAVTGNRLIKSSLVDAGILNGDGTVNDPKGYQVFMGRMLQAQQDWAAQHPTHKGPIPDQDMINIATPLLARRGATPPATIFGINVPFTGSKGQVAPLIPPDRYSSLHDQFVGQFGYEPTPEQIGREYELRRDKGLEK